MRAEASAAERMDRHYRLQRHVYDLSREHFLIGRKHLIGDIAPLPGQTVLEIGCGTAWNLVEIARRYPSAHCFGIDISIAMLETAATSVRRRGLGQRITLRQGDATNFDAMDVFGVGHFDRIVLSYALSMIPSWRAAVHHASGLLAPGGSLHVVDFGDCAGLSPVLRRGLYAFLSHYAVTPRADLPDVICALASEHGFAAKVVHLHRGYTDYAVLQRR